MESERSVSSSAQPRKHKMLAPKVTANAEQATQDAAKSIMDNKEPGRDPDPDAVTEFAFINTTSDVQYSGTGSRSAARSHVMRNFHRKRGHSRQQSGKSRPPGTSQSSMASSSSQGQSGSDENLSNMERMTLMENEGAAEGSSALLHMAQLREQHPGQPQLSMSNLWALPVDAHSTGLIYHYVQNFAKSFVTMNQAWESAWFKNAISDPACFHGTLFLSLAHKALLTGTEGLLPAECFHHRGEVIRIINERMSDPMTRVKDGTIAAIACLAAFETLAGTTTDATVHVGGLKKLVDMRGGLKQLGMDGYLEQFLYWVDLSNATATREKPHFLLFEPLLLESKHLDAEALWKYCDSQWNEKSLEPLPEKSYQGLDVVENRLFHLLRQLTILASSNLAHSSGPNQEAYANLVLLLERQIGIAVQERIAFKKRFADVTFCPPTCLFYIPALIICYMSLRPTPVRSSIYEPLILRMKHHIENLVPRQLFDRFLPEFWFWALLFTGAASMGRPQQAYFQQVTAQLCNMLNVHTWEKAKDILKEFAWADSVCERPCKAFWDTLQTVEVGHVEEDVNLADYVRLDMR